MHVPGVVLALIGGYLAWLGVRRRQRILAAWAAAQEAGGAAPGRAIHASLSVLADIAAPLMLLGLALAGGQVALAFVLTDGGGLFSLVDLAGFLLLLAGYGVWFWMKTRYRLDRLPD